MAKPLVFSLPRPIDEDRIALRIGGVEHIISNEIALAYFVGLGQSLGKSARGASEVRTAIEQMGAGDERYATVRWMRATADAARLAGQTSDLAVAEALDGAANIIERGGHTP